ncbi:YraN family protein [Candidatus Shapirobacteria bacterium]|nr:YraN family protein [Candidatus Shapirobacteria bacterium]
MPIKEFNFKKGRRGEEEARVFLEQKGYELIEQNYVNDLGEIDLIMSDKDWLVFVEVKFKSDDRLGMPEEMLTKTKLAQVKRVAKLFLVMDKKIQRKFVKYRIDGVCILGEQIRHYINIV